LAKDKAGCWTPKCTCGWAATPKPGAVRMSLDAAREAVNAHVAAVEATLVEGARVRRHYARLDHLP
jgi:hypothetical protein